MKTLQTARLVLRPWQLSDAADMFEYARSPKVGPMAGWKPHENLTETETILNRFIREDETWALVLRSTGTVIGSIGLHPNRQAEVSAAREIGYVLAEPYWGKGLMPEAVRAVIDFAFTELRLDHLLVAHFPFNQQSRRVIEKCGFTWLKHLQASWQRFDGTSLDEEIYIMARETFLADRMSAENPI